MEQAVILIVDDKQENLQALGETLEAQGYQVIAATNAAQAMSVVEAHPVDLVLLDVLMPGTDGFTVCRHLKAQAHTAIIPIIFVTIKNDVHDIIAGLQMGAVDYITKPFNIAELSVRVRTHIELKLSRDRIQQQNHELSRINAELLDTIELKNKMLGVAAHDLRNPLTSILTGVDLLLRNPAVFADERAQKVAASVRRAAVHMEDLINQTLEVAALELGKVHLQYTDVWWHAFVRSAIAHYEHAAEQKSQAIVFRAVGADCVVQVDTLKMQQVLDNLLSNAVKYSPLGATIEVIAAERDAKVSVAVRDEGLGLTEDDKTRVFGMFQRLSARPTAGESSTGIGLAIAKHIVELHQGTIAVESRRDEGIPGATFVVELPLRPSM